MQSSGTYQRLPRRSILFIEADADLRALYAELAESLCATVVVARDAGEADALLREHELEVVVMEVPLGAKALGEIAARLRATARGASVVAVTADHRVDAALLLRAGFDAVLRKPFGVDDLEAAITRSARAVRARREARTAR